MINAALHNYSLAYLSLSKDENSVLSSLSEAKSLLDILKDNDDFIKLCSNYLISKEERISLIDKCLIDYSFSFRNFLKVLVSHNLFNDITYILQDYISLANEELGIKEGYIYSTYRLNKEEMDKIISLISQKEKAQISLINKIDSTLIGGIKIVINDHVYDDSISHHINQYKSNLTKRGFTYEH